MIDVGAGEVIDNSTSIPDGAVINLNGGTIASGTVFSAANFPNGFTLNINDGVVGLGVEINNATINIAGGQVALGASDLSESCEEAQHLNLQAGRLRVLEHYWMQQQRLLVVRSRWWITTESSIFLAETSIPFAALCRRYR